MMLLICVRFGEFVEALPTKAVNEHVKILYAYLSSLFFSEKIITIFINHFGLMPLINSEKTVSCLAMPARTQQCYEDECTISPAMFCSKLPAFYPPDFL